MTAGLFLYPLSSLCLNLDLQELPDYLIFWLRILRWSLSNPWLMAIMVKDVSHCPEAA